MNPNNAQKNPRPRRQKKANNQVKPKRGKNKKRVVKQVNGPKVPKSNIAQIVPLANNRDERALGTRSNIMIMANADPQAILGTGISLIGMVLSRGYETVNPLNPIYWAYFAFIHDVIAVMTAMISQVTGRLRYVNEILGSLAPKSVPFRGVGSIAYSWGNSVAAAVPTSTYVVRGFTTYMYVQSATTLGPWRLQIAPPAVPDTATSTSTLALAYNLLTDNKTSSLLSFTKGTTLGTLYTGDVSAFAQSATYYGGGNTSSNGPAYSSEAEVPFRSIILSNFVDFTAFGRVSRFLKFGSGDTTCAFGLGALPQMKLNYYNTAFAPIYKFIDAQEVVATLVYWYQQLSAQAANELTSGPAPDNAFVFTPFAFTAVQFEITVRQCLMALFNDTQALAQFLTPSQTPNGFEAFRIGSNTYGKNLTTNIVVPNVLRENIANLMTSFYDIKGKFHNDKNCQMIIPVWGTFSSSAAINAEISVWNGTEWVLEGLFTNPIVTDPNVIDGTDSLGNVYDLNNSNVVTDLIGEWNERIDFLKGYSIPVSYLGGSSGRGHLLYMTRLNSFRSIDLKAEYSRRQRNFHKKSMNPDLVKKIPLTRKDSRNTVEYETKYLPAGAGVAEAYTNSITSLIEITATFKQALPYIILPMIPLEPNVAPSQNQWRTTGLEAKLLDLSTTTTDGTLNRLNQLLIAGMAFAPGRAASNTDEMANVITAMNGEGEGGFFGDLIGNVLTVGAQVLGKAIPV